MDDETGTVERIERRRTPEPSTMRNLETCERSRGKQIDAGVPAIQGNALADAATPARAEPQRNHNEPQRPLDYTHSETSPLYTMYKDMLSNPHLLIAGATGSGKSVIVNALIYTALYKFPLSAQTANSVGFILIDPKRCELVDYKDLPHTLRYASEPAEMVQALDYAMELTEKRYMEMQRKHIKKYDGGHIFILIDEFADLMTTNKKQVQPLIQRVAQIGRAACVHIILCTQCPLAKVIPTEIKVNFDARVALRTECAQDSRNIIRVSGCELLPRYGQGYYKTPEGITLCDIPMIPQEELSARIKWWMNQRPRGLFSKLFNYAA